MFSSRGSSQPRGWIHVFYVSCTGRQVLYHWCYPGSPSKWMSFTKGNILSDAVTRWGGLRRPEGRWPGTWASPLLLPDIWGISPWTQWAGPRATLRRTRGNVYCTLLPLQPVDKSSDSCLRGLPWCPWCRCWLGMLIYLQLKSAHKDLSVLIRRSVKWYCGENMGLGCLTDLKSNVGSGRLWLPDL